MTWLTENPTPPVVLGIVIEALLVIVLMKTGRREALWGMIFTAAVTIAVVIANFAIVTPREEVTTALEEIRQLVEQNDRPELVKRIDPAAVSLRNQVQYDLASLTVEKAKIDKLKVLVDDSGASAKAEFDGVVVIREGMSRPIPLRFRVELRKLDGRWVVSSAEYQPYNPLDGGASRAAPMAKTIGDGVG
jgi:hypothetical protein